jgi:hypothetical protein
MEKDYFSLSLLFELQNDSRSTVGITGNGEEAI